MPGHPWAAAEVEALRRLWPEYRSARIGKAGLASAVGRPFRGCWDRAKLMGMTRPRATFGRLKREVAALNRQGLSNTQIAGRLGVHRTFVKDVLKRLGLSSPARPGTAGHRRASRAGLLRQCRDLGIRPGHLPHEIRRNKYAGLGYPFGVKTVTDARIVDACRRQGGVCAWELLPSPRSSPGHINRRLDALVGMGILTRGGKELCPVRGSMVRRTVTVYRLATEYPSVGREGRAGHYSCREG
jgi:hypothetical protein